jgi:hypothetical protein
VAATEPVGEPEPLDMFEPLDRTEPPVPLDAPDPPDTADAPDAAFAPLAPLPCVPVDPPGVPLPHAARAAAVTIRIVEQKRISKNHSRN